MAMQGVAAAGQSGIAAQHNVQADFDAVALSWRTGSEIRGLDLRDAASISDNSIKRLRGLLAERGVLLFRDQHLDHDQHLDFTRRFGPLAEAGFISRNAPPGYPDLFTVTNMVLEGERSETWDSARQWHSDQSFLPVPATGSLLRCVRAPQLGGDTMFANLFVAAERLSEGLRATLENLRCYHDLYNTNNRQRLRRKEFTPEEAKKWPGTWHPVLKPHPLTGEKALFVSEQMIDRFEGWTIEESAPLLQYLVRYATQPAFTYRHHWRPGDLIFWDNHCTLHHAPPDYDVSALDAPENVRLMYRSTLA